MVTITMCGPEVIGTIVRDTIVEVKLLQTIAYKHMQLHTIMISSY